MTYINNWLSKFIKFCPKSGKPVKAYSKWIVPIFAVLSLIWIVIRLLPKPQRASYPCMKVAIPFATSLLLYLGSLAASVVFFKKAYKKALETKYAIATIFVLSGFIFVVSSYLLNSKYAMASAKNASSDFNYEDPLGPNVPIGDAKGIIPGRVVWVHNPDATNENCIPYNLTDGYFLDKNADQDIIDSMLKTAILDITGNETEFEAWENIFTYFNETHGKDKVGYAEGETIFIKINAVHAWDTNDDLSIPFNDAYGDVDTSPQLILSVIRQLVLNAGVPQEAIYIGDPYTNIFKHIHTKLSAEFPNIHYMSQRDYDKREKLQKTNTETIKFSDKGNVLDVTTDSYYDCVVNADYVLSLPALKGHRGAGVTFFAKNHFGTNIQASASHMHAGLVKATSDPIRGDYKQYRVLVDLMSYEHLGGKTLIYIGDFLWGTSMEHDPPVKFQSEPFNNDWTSSVLVSLDPVAIASVGLDILQAEFTEEDHSVYPPRELYVHFTGVDDYLHQAASSDWWPEGFIYDPEDDGTPIESLGVHEHWNNAQEKAYSRNLGTGNGIELIYKFTKDSEVTINDVNKASTHIIDYVSGNENNLTFKLNDEINEPASIMLYNLSGQLIDHIQYNKLEAGERYELPIKTKLEGNIIFVVQSGSVKASKIINIKQL